MAAHLPRLAFLRSTALRWVLLGLYALVLLVTLWIVLLATNKEEDRFTGLLWWILAVGTQALFIFMPGVRDLVRPVKKKRRLFCPAFIAGAMLALLVLSFISAMQELFNWDGFPEFVYILLFFMNWIAWSIFFFLHTRARGRFMAFKRMTNFILCGSLLELLACIPAHIVVSRRPGCLVGIFTGSAVAAGIAVMLWAFGPGIAILFLAPKHEREVEGAAGGGPIASAPLKRWNFSLGGLTLVILFLGSVMAVLAIPIDPHQPFMTRYEAWCMMVLSVLVTVRLLKRLSRWEKEE